MIAFLFLTSAAFNFSNAVTIEAWLKTGNSADTYIVTKGEDSFFLALGGGVSNNKPAFYLHGPSDDWLRSTSELNDNQWHHVAGTYDGATLKVYVDGVWKTARPAVETFTMPVPPANAPLHRLPLHSVHPPPRAQ